MGLGLTVLLAFGLATWGLYFVSFLLALGFPIIGLRLHLHFIRFEVELHLFFLVLAKRDFAYFRLFGFGACSDTVQLISRLL